MQSKDLLQSRSKLIAERLSESMHILDHDPSMALYRLQEHVNKTLGILVDRKYQMMNLNMSLQGACFDLDNALQTIDEMSASTSTFDGIQQKLQDCLRYKNQIECRRGVVNQQQKVQSPQKGSPKKLLTKK